MGEMLVMGGALGPVGNEIKSDVLPVINQETGYGSEKIINIGVAMARVGQRLYEELQAQGATEQAELTAQGLKLLTQAVSEALARIK